MLLVPVDCWLEWCGGEGAGTVGSGGGILTTGSAGTSGIYSPW